MARFRLTHPTDGNLVAEYGFDPFCGWFVEVFMGECEEPLTMYDALQAAYDHAQPLLGALRFLVKQGFFSTETLDMALYAHTAHQTSSRMSRRVRRVLVVIENIKRAAD